MQLKAMKPTKTFKDLVMNTYIFLYLHSNSGSGGRVARLSSAKAATAVRIRFPPLLSFQSLYVPPSFGSYRHVKHLSRLSKSHLYILAFK